MLSLLRSMLFDNLGIKFVALLLALALYLHVYTERPATMIVAFPLEITDLADTLSLIGAAPEPVRAELRGTGKQLIRLRLTEPRIKLSLAGVRAGHYERMVVADDLPLLHDEALEVQRLISPRVVSLDLDSRLERRVPVAVSVAGAPRSGWVWNGAVTAQPATVLLNGPRRTVARIDSVRLHPVQIEGRIDTLSAEVRPDSLPRWCTIEPTTVRVSVALKRLQPLVR
jgi:YbbR domain-containing protein